MTEKFDKEYLRICEEHQINENYLLRLLKNNGTQWLLRSIEEYLGEKYGQDGSKRYNALKRIILSFKTKDENVQRIINIIKKHTSTKINKKIIIKTFEDILNKKINLYDVHTKIRDELSELFNEKSYEEFKKEMLSIYSV